MNHTCGGELLRTKLKIRKKIGYYFQTFTVDGYKCGLCGEEVITGDVALEIDEAIKQLRRIWRDWKVPAETQTTRKGIKGSLFEVSNNVKAVYHH